MSDPARRRGRLRRPLALASVIALTSGLALATAPSAGASAAGLNKYIAVDASDPLSCTDDNLTGLARATGGELHTLVKDGQCYVVHRFSESGDFTITSMTRFEMLIMVVGAGGAGGGGSGWEDSWKLSGAEPDSGAGAGGAGGTVRTARGMFSPDPHTGGLAYTPTKNQRNNASFSEPDGPPFGVGDDHPYFKPVRVGRGGSPGVAGTSTAGSTVGGQGGTGGDSSFGELIASGGSGGFGGRGIEGSEPGVQFGWAESPRAGGQKGGMNYFFEGGDLGLTPDISHSAPGGAGAVGPGLLPVERDAVNHIGDGGVGGDGISTDVFSSSTIDFACGGGGGTLNPASPPFSAVVGGAAGRGALGSCGGDGSAGGNGKDAPGWCPKSSTPHTGGCGGAGEVETPEIGNGAGGGGGGTDGSVTPGDSNAGTGGRGGDGVVLVRYPALTAPITPAAPSVEVGDGSVTLTISPLADTPDQYYLWVAGDPDRNCTITPPETSCVIEGLTNGESYTFLAAAGNAAGHSAASTASVAIAPGVGILPYTGTNTRGLTALALTMIGLGGVITLLTRRRRTIS